MVINRGCIILWIVLFLAGLLLAVHKPLWCDELYGQKLTIEASSWKEILLGRTDTEANSFPLYNLLQKAFLLAIHFQLPDEIKQDFMLPTTQHKFTFYLHHRGQILMRILPDVLMSTAIVILVRFFWLRGGLAVAAMALLSSLSCGMVWWYWVEARLYPLWFLLTLVQAVFLLEILTDNQPAGRLPGRLVAVNWLLAATTALGFVQVALVQLILFCFGRRKFKDHLWAGIFPVGAALLWLSGRTAHALYLQEDPSVLIKTNFSYELAGLLFFYLIAFACRRSWCSDDGINAKKVWRGLLHLVYLAGGFGLGILLLAYIAWRWPNANQGIPVYCRHFLYLSALGVVMVPAMFSDLWHRSSGSSFWRSVFLILFIVLLLTQMADTFRYIAIMGGYL